MNAVKYIQVTEKPVFYVDGSVQWFYYRTIKREFITPNAPTDSSLMLITQGYILGEYLLRGL